MRQSREELAPTLYGGVQDVYRGLVGLWAARLALGEDRCLVYLAEDSEDASELRRLLSLPVASGAIPRRKLREMLTRRIVGLRRYHDRETPLHRNLDKLAAIIGLSAVEKDLLAFSAWLTASPELHELASKIRHCSDAQMADHVARTIDADRVEVKCALGRASTLAETGLLRPLDDFGDFANKLQLRDGLVELLLDEAVTEEGLLCRFFDIATGTGLTARDFEHLADELRLISDYLSAAFGRSASAVNILFYGPPGTGKTEFAKIVARSIGKPLYVVGSRDDSGEAASLRERAGSYRVCQRFLERNGNGLILFDEIEDLFPIADQSARPWMSKAWMNSLLERNPVPAIWICNEVSHIDPAYLRRFDYSVRFGQMPRATRARIIRRHLESLPVSDECVDALTKRTSITAAQIGQAAKVAGLTKAGRFVADRVVTRIINGSGALLGHPAGASTAAVQMEMSHLNADYNLAHLIDRLRTSSLPVSICLYGPPGTGKTTAAVHMASALSRPLHHKHGSDVLSPWVGVAEQQIRQMFEQAESEHAVLFLDESDGLLADRSRAERSWEVTVTNEFLARMESFRGIFVCATNLLERVDVAAFRRFTLKIRFDYLTSKQREAIIRDWFPGDGEEVAACLPQLAELDTLAIGDVALVRHRMALLSDSLTPAAFVENLRRECQLKNERLNRRIGFAA